MDKAIALAKAAPAMSGLDLAKVVTKRYLRSGPSPNGPGHGVWSARPPRVSTWWPTTGVRKNILRMLAERGCKVTVVPAQTSAARWPWRQARRHLPEQWPRRPGACDYAISAAKELIESSIPTFGICLGHQIMALASGAKTFKMKFSHHGANHPVKDLDIGRVSITSQNHGFAVDESPCLPTCAPRT